MLERHLFVKADWLKGGFTNKTQLQMIGTAINVNGKARVHSASMASQRMLKHCTLSNIPGVFLTVLTQRGSHGIRIVLSIDT